MLRHRTCGEPTFPAFLGLGNLVTIDNLNLVKVRVRQELLGHVCIFRNLALKGDIHILDQFLHLLNLCLQSFVVKVVRSQDGLELCFKTFISSSIIQQVIKLRSFQILVVGIHTGFLSQFQLILPLRPEAGVLTQGLQSLLGSGDIGNGLSTGRGGLAGQGSGECILIAVGQQDSLSGIPNLERLQYLIRPLLVSVGTCAVVGQREVVGKQPVVISLLGLEHTDCQRTVLDGGEHLILIEVEFVHIALGSIHIVGDPQQAVGIAGSLSTQVLLGRGGAIEGRHNRVEQGVRTVESIELGIACSLSRQDEVLVGRTYLVSSVTRVASTVEGAGTNSIDAIGQSRNLLVGINLILIEQLGV